MKLLLALAILASLTGCRTQPMTAADVQKCSTVSGDPSKHEMQIASPRVGGAGMASSSLVAELRDGKVFVYYLHHGHGGQEWSDLKSATDANGAELELVRNFYGTNSAGRFENVSVRLSRQSLDDASNGSGLLVHIHGGKHSVDVSFPAQYVQGFLARVDSSTR